MNVWLRMIVGLAVLAFLQVSAVAYETTLQLDDKSAQVAKVQQGVFVGDLQLCSESVEEISVRPEEHTGQMVVSIILEPSTATRFGELTQRLIGQSLPIMLDGKVIISPIVWEPIFGGAIQITGATIEEQKRLVTAMQQPC